MENANTMSMVFNTPTEIALRSLIILGNTNSALTLDKLVAFDYLSLNTADIGGPESLHPPIPHRSVQLLVRRELIQKGLHLLISKGLIKIKLNSKGICYCSTKLTLPFLNYLDSSYKKRLEEKAKWVIENFGNKSEKALSDFLSKNLDKWGGEISYETTNRI